MAHTAHLNKSPRYLSNHFTITLIKKLEGDFF